MPQDASKMPPRRLQNASKTPKTLPRRPKCSEALPTSAYNLPAEVPGAARAAPAPGARGAGARALLAERARERPRPEPRGCTGRLR